jgi:hypothetical protein
VVFVVFLLEFGAVPTVWYLLFFYTVGTAPNSNRKTKKYHTVGTAPNFNRKTKNTTL